MKEQNKNIDAYFLEELGNITETPPASVWTSLEQRLDAKPRAKTFGWWFWSLLLVVLFSGSVIGYRAWLGNEEHKSSAPVLTAPENKSAADARVLPENTTADNPGRYHTTDRQQGNAVTAASGRYHKDPGDNATTLSSTHGDATGNDEDVTKQYRTAGKRHKNIAATQSYTKRPLPSPGSSSATGEENSGPSSAEPAGTITGRSKGARNSTSAAGPVLAANSGNQKSPAARTSESASGNQQNKNTGRSNKTISAASTEDIKKDQNNISADAGNSGNATAATKQKSNAGRSNKSSAANTDHSNAAGIKEGQENGIASSQNTAGSKQKPASSAADHTQPANDRTAASSENSNKQALAAKTSGRPIAPKAAKNKAGGLTVTPAKSRGKEPLDIQAAKDHGTETPAAKATPAKGTALVVTPAKNGRKKPAGNDPAKDKMPLAAAAGNIPAAKKPVQQPAPKDNATVPANSSADHTPASAPKPAAADKQATAIVPKEPAKAQPNTANTSKIKITDENGQPVAPQASLPATKSKPDAGTDAAVASTPAAPKEDFLKQKVQDQEGGGGGGGGASSPPTKPKKPKVPRLEGGVKLGYETGAGTYTASKYVAAAYLQYNITSRLGIAVQPAVKSATTNNNYQPNSDSTYYLVTATSRGMFDRKDTFYSWALHQTYDSSVLKKSVPKQYTEIDIPLMLRYKVDKHIVLSAGINMTFGAIITVGSQLQSFKGLQYNDTVFTHGDSSNVPPYPGRYSHPGSSPFSSYVPSANSSTPSPMRFGYTFGISYTFKERFMVDFMVQKTTSNQGYISDSKIRDLYAQHYFRLMFGYKLFGSKKQVRNLD